MSCRHIRLALSLFSILFLCLAPPALGLDLFSFHGAGRCPTVGAVVALDNGAAHILTLEGTQQRISLSEISAVAQYSVLEAPFSRLVTRPGDIPPLRVRLKGDQAGFSGFATNFFSGVAFFLDLAGQTRVVELRSITSAHPEPTAASQQEMPGHGVRVRFPEQLRVPEDCTVSAAPLEISSVRVVNDSLRLQSFFSDLGAGYSSLEKLVERASFYPVPQLYDTSSRLGFLFSKSLKQTKLSLTENILVAMLPVYLETGAGTPYGYQGFFKGGAGIYDPIPSFKPEFGFETDFKAHVLHGSLVGNLAALPAGKSVFLSRVDDLRPTRPLWASTSFNHLTLVGADYGPFSLSFGTFYPTFVFGQDQQVREVVSFDASWSLRIGYRTLYFMVDSFLHFTDIDKKTEYASPAAAFDSDPVLKAVSSDRSPHAVSLQAQSCRSNLTIPVREDLLIGGGVVLARAVYAEDARMTDSTFRSSKVTSLRYGLRGFARMDFGQWLALRGEGVFERSRLHGGFRSDAETANSSDLTLFGALEVLL